MKNIVPTKRQSVKFKDGTVVYLNNEALPNNVGSKEYDNNSNLLVKTYGDDVASVLDDLEKLNDQGEDFKGKLNLNGVGQVLQVNWENYTPQKYKKNLF